MAAICANKDVYITAAGHVTDSASAAAALTPTDLLATMPNSRLESYYHHEV